MLPRSGANVPRRNLRTKKFGSEAITTIAAVLWGNFQNEIKNSECLNILDHKIKQWTPNNCPCKICRNLIKNLRYIYMKTAHLYSFSIFTVRFMFPYVI